MSDDASPSRVALDVGRLLLAALVGLPLTLVATLLLVVACYGRGLVFFGRRVLRVRRSSKPESATAT